MTEIFTAELTVAERDPRQDRQLAEIAIGWFGGPVQRLSLDVSVIEVEGLTSYLMRGRFRAAARVDDVGGRPGLRAAAEWLGLRPPSSSS